MAMLFLWQDELDRDNAGAIAADLLLAPVAPAWGKGFAETPPTIAILCAGSECDF